ncbi:substrate-binding domain-containing protein [Ponticaulis koreensis]|uniref:substrate-binding domain-containing protein n=1 Tax=Ponticaulis koreensis TaxID=1123045 RepID=UPI0003B32D8B|nr:substrate-binding domain-containing protein [Ponticaulis koreensis]
MKFFTGKASFAAGLGLMLCLAACEPSAGSGVDAGRTDERIVIAGSSTVAPFVTRAAEYFGATSEYRVPIVETTGTGGGIRLFCEGDGPDTISIATASRRMTESEQEYCASNGVSDFLELPLGSDGIVLINALNGPEIELTDREIFLALAKTVPTRRGLAANPYQFWSEINPELPDMRIEVYGPPPTSGTRDAFTEIVLERGALRLPEIVDLRESDAETYNAVAHTIRTDGHWLDSGENDTQIVQALIRSPSALGVAGYSYLEQSSDRVKPASVNGTLPDEASIMSGDYAVSRSLFLYVKRSHIEQVPALRPFLDELFSDVAMGEGGYLVEVGLIPLSLDDRANVLTISQSETPDP